MWGFLVSFFTISAEKKKGELENVSNFHHILLKVVPYGKLFWGLGTLRTSSCRADSLEINPMSRKTEMPLSP